MVALRVTHENSSKSTTEYFYGDTLAYAAPYTDWKNRIILCETMNAEQEFDDTLIRLKRKAFNGCRRHFHKPTRQQNRVSQQDTEIDAHPLEEVSEPNNFQGKLKIKIFDLHETFIHDTDPFDETKLNWWVDLETKHINDSCSFSGLTVFQWDHESKKWMPYRPDGVHEMTYDTGRRSDGIHEACRRQISERSKEMIKI